MSKCNMLIIFYGTPCILSDFKNMYVCTFHPLVQNLRKTDIKTYLEVA